MIQGFFPAGGIDDNSLKLFIFLVDRFHMIEYWVI
jgi:hypothetical protein